MLASRLESCEIILPYWMEFAEGMPELARYLRDTLRASVAFQPLESTHNHLREDGIPARSLPLAAVAEEELEKARQGMLERIKNCGSYE